jgi:hypothetical protein
MIQSIRYPYTVRHADGTQTIPIQWRDHILYDMPIVDKLYQYSDQNVSISTQSVVEDPIEFVQMHYF